MVLSPAIMVELRHTRAVAACTLRVCWSLTVDSHAQLADAPVAIPARSHRPSDIAKRIRVGSHGISMA